MFNLRQAQLDSEAPHRVSPEDLFSRELALLDIFPFQDHCELELGDDRISVASLYDCITHIKEAINELKEQIWENWKDLGHFARIIKENNAGNSGGIDNIFFLNSVKVSYLLSKKFSDLQDISLDLEKLFHVDISEVHDNLIHKFNTKYLEIRTIHYLIMKEIYRFKVLKKYLSLYKQAQISGPWANLELPMKERVWEWDDDGDGEYFENRTRARKEQTRYNPETDKLGFFFVWQDLTRDPYKFDDYKDDSPYKSRHLLTIP